MIIDQLPEISSVQATDELPIERGITTYKIPLSKLSDDEPTSASEKPVKSGGVYAALQGKTPADLGITGATANDLVGISAVSDGKPTGFKAVSPNAVKLNPNLLDNWYFVGGGTGTYGAFPVNQRGQASYSSNDAYTVDRWKLRTVGGSCTVGADGLTISGGTDTQSIVQTFPDGGKALRGKKVTFSALITAKGTQSAELIIGNASAAIYVGTNLGSAIASVGLTSVTVDIPATLSNPYLNFMITTQSGGSYTVAAMKVEIGDTQTLAHQENGAWVLNEVPDYSEQLYRCLDSHADSSDTYANKSPSDYLNNSLPSKIVTVNYDRPSFHIPNNCRAWGAVLDSSPSNCGLYAFISYSNGAGNVVQFSNSGPTATPGQNTITFSLTQGQSFSIMCITPNAETLDNIYQL